MEFDKIRLNGQKVIDLPIVNLSLDAPYLLKAADGLGPPEASVNITMNTNDLGIYQGRRPQGREIVLRMALNPNYSMSETVAKLRSDLYGVLTPGTVDGFVFQLLLDEEVQAQTTGYVKSFEIVPFNRDPEVQITIACVSPYFQAPAMIEVEPEDLHPNAPTRLEVYNPGTAPSGVIFELTMLVQSNSISILDKYGYSGPDDDPYIMGDENIFLLYDSATPFLLDSKITVNTIPGQRHVTQVDVGDPTVWSAIPAVSPETTWWPMLHGGDNLWLTALNQDRFVFSKFSFLPQYWGV